MKKVAFLLASAVLLSSAVSAQESEKTKDKYNTWSAGVHFGNLLSIDEGKGFLTDGLNDEVGFDLGYGVHVTKSFNHVFALRLQGLFGNVSSGITSGAYTETSMTNLNLALKINITNWTLSRKEDRKAFFYATGGGGLAFYGTDNYNPDGSLNASVTGESAGLYALGLGVTFKLTDNLNLDLSTTSHFVGSDGFDGFSPNADGRDGVLYTALGVNYIFGKKEQSADWVNPMDQMYMDLTNMQTTVDEISTDSDGDGVADMYDAENNTPAGVAVDGRGRAFDVDGDGVPDHVDEDPFTPKGATVTPDGREADSDGDGVPDSRDREPNTEAGELVNFQGVTIPSGELNGAYMPSIYFSLESSQVTYANYERLASVARALKMNPDAEIRIVGHADKTGSAEYNDKLATARAQAVADHLNKYYGIEMGRMEVVGKGFNDPLADGQNKINRRVDFEVK